MSTSVSGKKHIDELHFEHNLWQNNMKFYRDQITVFENRLEELIQKNTRVEVTAQIEQYQNQFIRQRDMADELISKCKDHDKFLSNQAINHPIAIDHVLFTDHTKLRDQVETYDRLYRELKSDFMGFLRKWM